VGVTKKSVTVEELGEHLQEYFAEVRKGTRIEVVADDGIVATIIPPLRFFDPGPRPKNLTTDPAEMIIAERERERSGEKYK
jgi:antitoxin (DNA-binding transcriptional repressor) of toxin-antitoxin stability system